MSRARARIRPDAAAAEAAPRRCDHPDCTAAGEYRAPRSRKTLTEYYWFCLDHVRAYNAAWDYYKGMSPEEIEAARRMDTVGWRPTWPMGVRRGRANGYRIDPDELRAAFRRFFDEDMFGADSGPSHRPPPRATTQEEEALAVLNLPAGATLEEVKARYKELVKRNHPDANGGDKAAEERLKLINQAYTYLKTQAQNAKFNGRD
ncbi:MAG TPA: J domain-containing protein [Alphaproteobacteria bacterium]